LTGPAGLGREVSAEREAGRAAIKRAMKERITIFENALMPPRTLMGVNQVV
jgi:hypothetical protein